MIMICGLKYYLNSYRNKIGLCKGYYYIVFCIWHNLKVRLFHIILFYGFKIDSTVMWLADQNRLANKEIVNEIFRRSIDLS